MRAPCLGAAVAGAAVPIEKMSSLSTEAARPKSGILLEKGANGMPSHQRASTFKNGRVSQARPSCTPDVQACKKVGWYVHAVNMESSMCSV